MGNSTDTTVYAVHTITVKQGQLSISFSGTYDLVKTYQTTSCSWVITPSGSAGFTPIIPSHSDRSNLRGALVRKQCRRKFNFNAPIRKKHRAF